MEQFKIKKDSFKEIRKAMLFKTIPFLLLVVFGVIVINHFNPNGQQSEANVLPYLILMALVVPFGLYRGIKRQKEIIESYTLTIDNNCITREQHNTPTITISFKDLTEIIKNPNGSFTIKGNSPVDVIGIPAQIENNEKLEILLEEKRQISIKTSEPFLQKFRGLIQILTLGLMAAVFISKDKLLVGVAGTVLLVLFGYSFIEIQRSKNIDSKTKKGTWWLIIVAASIIAVMYFKLTGKE